MNAGTATVGERPRFQIVTSRGFTDWLAREQVSLAFTTYERGGLIFLGRRPDGELGLWASSFDRAMGLAATADRLWLSTALLLWRMENSVAPGGTQDGYDRVYVPRSAYTTGDLDIHDLAEDADGRPVFVNTRFNCLATTDPRANFRPLWRPPFISELTPEDRCHLNGLALDAGRAKYVTLVARSDVADGWRDFRGDGGLVMDVTTNEIVARGLSMPHSPRLHRGRLWLLESGTGHLGHVDPRTGTFERVAFMPGYARGLTLVGNCAVVGLSRPRREHSFQGLALDHNLADRGTTARCGLHVVDLERGATLHWARIESGIEELYDVAVLPGVVRPKALSFTTEAVGHQFCFEDEGRWQTWSAVQPSAPPTPQPANAGPSTETADTWFRRAAALTERNANGPAIEAFRRALGLQSDHVDALVGLARLLSRQEDLSEPVELLRRALRLRPGSAEITYTLAMVLDLAGAPGEALAGFRRAVRLDPDHLAARHRLAVRMANVCDWTRRDEEHSRIVAALRQRAAAGEPSPVDPWSLPTLPVSPADLVPIARSFSARYEEFARRFRTEMPDRTRPNVGRLRIGYLAHEFRHGALTQLMAGLFAHHDRERFEIFGYADTPDDGSDRRRRIAAGCDHFVALHELGVVDAARRIAADELDILVVLNLFTTDCRPEIAALRPAPVQVSYMLQVTSGADFLDYFLTDVVASPPGSEVQFSEKLVYLPPSCLAADGSMEIADTTPGRAECGLPDGAFVFCCFNNPYKIDPAIFDVWMRILGAVPGSVLWLFTRHAEVEPNLRREAEARGIDGNRLVFAGKVDHPDHLARHRLADLFLDTPLVNAHTTAVDALAAGMPILTCPGALFARRVAASVLTAAGLPELIVPDLAAYEQRAVELAGRPEELADIRDRLATAIRSAGLLDPVQFVRPLEAAFVEMARCHHADERPESFDVNRLSLSGESTAP